MASLPIKTASLWPDGVVLVSPRTTFAGSVESRARSTTAIVGTPSPGRPLWMCGRNTMPMRECANGAGTGDGVRQASTYGK